MPVVAHAGLQIAVDDALAARGAQVVVVVPRGHGHSSRSDAGATWAVLGPPYGVDTDPVPAVDLVADAAATRR